MARELNYLRYFLITGVIILAISGVIVAAYAAYFIYQLYEYPLLTPDNVCGCSGILLGMGVMTCILSWSTWQFMDFTNKCQVLMYAVFLILIVCTEASAGIWALVRHEQIDAFPIDGTGHTSSSVVVDNSTAWDYMQSKLYCCGTNGPSDYYVQESIPSSCCNTSTFTKFNNSNEICVLYYERGCFHVVVSQTRSILLRTFLLALCAVLLEICIIACIISYARAFSKSLENRKKRLMQIKEMSMQVNNMLDNKKVVAQQ